MLIELLKSKIHRATVTDANLNYEGSITLDIALMEAAQIREFEKVGVLNINTGARFDTYAIIGPRNSGTVCLNGAAARLVQPGDLVIILTYTHLTPDEADKHKPIVVHVDASNKQNDPV